MPPWKNKIIFFYSILQVAVSIRLYEYWHEQVKIRNNRWNNKEIKKFQYIQNDYKYTIFQFQNKGPRGEKWANFTTGARATEFPLFNFLFTYLFSIKFLYFFIISSIVPYFNLFVSIFIQSYANSNLQNRIEKKKIIFPHFSPRGPLFWNWKIVYL
jgi:hypothetical protein